MILGWNSFERLSSNDNMKYIQGGFLNFLQTVFVNKISKDKIELNSIVKRIYIHEKDQYVSIEILRQNHDRIRAG